MGHQVVNGIVLIRNVPIHKQIDLTQAALNTCIVRFALKYVNLVTPSVASNNKHISVLLYFVGNFFKMSNNFIKIIKGKLHCNFIY